ncbi:MAG: D-alanine--D-alanine ligase [Prevotellaceae bacterium]|jgi:D-alanine-D-alanine ligase|nr:D-alanine--D-alanine ligase [Prevotellaceae bacterium]
MERNKDKEGLKTGNNEMRNSQFSNFKYKIAILYGGNSSEKVISERSSMTVEKYLPKEKYSAYRVSVSGLEWNIDMADGRRIPVNKGDFSFICDGEKIAFDCAFIIIHGTPGEDGILQAYFDLLGVPYTTCDPFVSALTFNKYACKCYLRSMKIDMAADFLLKKNDAFDRDAIERAVAYPMFVKPNAGGSSFGVAKVCSSSGLEDAIEAARREDGDVIIESLVEGIELSHGIYSTNRRTLEFPVTQIISKNSFFDYEAKYEGKSDEITPAPISGELSGRVKSLTKKIVNRLGCRGLVRVDYICSGNRLYFLEINTIPGMSEASIVPQQILDAGFGISQTLDWLIDDSIHSKKQES